MSVPLESGDRKILIIAGGMLLVFIAIALRFAPTPAQRSSGIPSTYSSSSDGAKAAFLLLKELGYNTARWEMPPGELSRKAEEVTLILAEPLLPASGQDLQAIHEFLREGGTVVGTGAAVAKLLPQARTSPYEKPGAKWKAYHPVLPSPLARDAQEVTMEPRLRWAGSGPDQLAVYAEGENAVVVTYPYGRGRVIWWAASTPLENAGIAKSGNLNLLLNSIGPRQGRQVLWDEFFHGQRGSLWSYFEGTPIPWGLAQCGVVALAVFLTFGRRAGPIRAPQVESRLAPLEFVETLGDLYHRAHAASAAVSIEYQRFRYLLTRRLGVPPSASIAQLHEAVRERLGWREPGFYETLQHTERALRDPNLSDADALSIAQALEQYEDLWQLKPRKSEEKRAWRNRSHE
jgi:hypothetical protein